MATFSFKARTSAGTIDLGILEAESLNEAAARLRQRGVFPISIKPSKQKDDTASKPARASGNVSRNEIIAFAHELSMLLEAGVTIREALDCVAQQATSPAMRDVLETLSQKVQAGDTLSGAMAERSDIFPKLMIGMIRASEASGTLDVMLNRISGYLDQEQKIHKTIRSALTYPAVMFVATFIITSFLIGFVLPRFASIYADRGADLPLPTKLLMGLSGTVTTQWHIILAVAVATITGLIFFFRSQAGRRTIDTAKLSLPIVGPLFETLYRIRSLRMMSVMINAGVPLLEVLTTTRDASTNIHFENLVTEMENRVKQGGSISEAMRGSDFVPPSITQMVVSGEKAGRIGEVMTRIADRSEEEFAQKVKALTQFVEPAMIGVLGLVVGFVAIALLLPIFSVGKVVSGG